MRGWMKWLLVLGVLGAQASCVVPMADEYWQTPDYDRYKIQTVTVLPVRTEAIDIRGQGIVRGMVYEKLPERGYASTGAAHVDQVLVEKFGITDPGQIHAATPEELCQAFESDALLYGNILDWRTLTLGVHNKALVKVRFSLWSCRENREVWWAEDEEDESTVDINPASAAANTLATLQASYHLLAEEVVYNCMDSLPASK